MKKFLDRLLLVGTALLVIFAAAGGFLLADHYHVDMIWVMLAWVSLGFFAAVGWDYRQQFRSISFTSFFVAWLLLHLLIFVFVLGRLGWLYWLPAVFVELFFFYASASLLFGLRPPGRR